MSKRKADNKILIDLINQTIDCEFHDPAFNWMALSSKLNIKATKISSVLRATYNDSPDLYILKRRLDACRNFIQTDQLSVSHAAALTGFADLTKFDIVFKARFGISPRQITPVQ